MKISKKKQELKLKFYRTY